MNFSALLTIARQEIRINARNRWIVLFAGVFGILALAISYLGLVTEGYAGIQGFERTTASLLSLTLYLIPLLALTITTLSLTADRGATELLFSQPVARHQILLGKMLGLFCSIATAMLIGFGAAATLIAIEAGTDGFVRFAGFLAITLLLVLACLALGALLAIVSRGRAQALGLALLAWFFLVMLYDLVIVGAGFLLKERVANMLVFLSLFGNPVDAARVGGLISVGGVTSFGAAGAGLLKFLGGPGRGEVALVLTMIGWTIGPIAIACRILRRQDT
jgi:Cu-processing system permease protein